LVTGHPVAYKILFEHTFLALLRYTIAHGGFCIFQQKNANLLYFYHVSKNIFFSHRADELPYPNVTVCFAKYFDKRWLAGTFEKVFWI